jgi:hypothetical protein
VIKAWHDAKTVIMTLWKIMMISWRRRTIRPDEIVKITEI